MEKKEREQYMLYYCVHENIHKNTRKETVSAIGLEITFDFLHWANFKFLD